MVSFKNEGNVRQITSNTISLSKDLVLERYKIEIVVYGIPTSQGTELKRREFSEAG